MANNEFGDFQTPVDLARQCLCLLGLSDDALVLEPTCGKGSFLQAAASIAPHSQRFGIEINPTYAQQAAAWGHITTGNVFELELSSVANCVTRNSLFIVGNPPWVTAAELKRLDSRNIPPKENFKGVGGLDALLGSSNFDVSEFIILKTLREFFGRRFKLGMLCKTQVARNVLEYASAASIPISNAAVYRIDAMRWFNASVDACWFMMETNPEAQPNFIVNVFEDVFAPGTLPTSRFGIINDLLVSNVDKYLAVNQADGSCPYEWRSGLKHDAASVFELLASPQPTTKTGIVLDLESDYVFPLLKSTDVFCGRHHELSKWVILPQLEFGADTKHLRQTAPRLWKYLESNATILDGRKSSIYRNRPRFSVFGHGSYTFAPYKVAISGLHKEPIFRLVTPICGKPVILDDTCYMLPFTDPTEAAVVTSILNSPPCLALIDSLVFRDAKRPITKKLLSRLDLNQLPINFGDICKQAHALAGDSSLPFDTVRASALLGSLGRCDSPAVLF